ncbi:hypothetical protein [Actinoplanes subtropicus]|nr:hypothetical protein [Actinoplanes subtropicus]
MTPQSPEKTWQEKITVAAIAGLISGVTRAFAAKIFEHLTSC